MNRFVRRALAHLALALAVTLVALPARTAELIIGFGADVTSLDPHHTNLSSNNNLADMIFGTLVVADEKQQLRPGLAESWRTVDELTWEFRLRRGVKFHDGSELTADDVLFSIDRPATLSGVPGGFTAFTRPIVEKSAPDPYTVRLKTAAPYPNMPVDMRGLPIVSRKAATGAGSADFDSAKAAIGAGPYRLVRFARGDRIELARHDGFWGPRPQFDRVTIRLLTNDAARVAALLSGAVHVIDAVPTADIAKLRNNKEVALHTVSSNRMIFFWLDSSRERSPFVTDKAGKPLEKNPLRDARVRLALSKAINRPAIVERVMEGVAVQAGQFMPEGFFGLSRTLKPEPYDPEGARKLLAEAGYPDGFGLTLHGPNNRYVNDEQILQAAAQMLARVGIAARVESMPMSVYLSRAGKLDFSVGLLGWGVITGEAGYPLKALTATWDRDKGNGTFNYGRYSNPKMDDLLALALRTIDNPAREKLFAEVTDGVLRDQAVIPLHFQVNVWAARRGYVVPTRVDERTYAHDVRLTQ